MHVLINASNVTAAGPRVVVLNLLPSLLHVMSNASFTILLPDDEFSRSMVLPRNGKRVYVRVSRGISNEIRRIGQLLWWISRVARKVGPDLCLTLGDLGPVLLPCPHVIFLHTAPVLYSRRELGWKLRSVPKLWFITNYFALTARKAAYIVVQTPVMMGRLIKGYGRDKSQIVEIAQPTPNHVALDSSGATRDSEIASCDKPVRLLFLAAYYEHKNHRILPNVARELRYRKLSDRVHIFVTLSEKNRESRDIRMELNRHGDVITNLGGLALRRVAPSLRASTALFLPTLVESYGLAYLEAMMCGLPILTSDRDFARWMCRDLAMYFDPDDPSSVVDTIELFTEKQKDFGCIQRFRDRLNEFPKDWDVVAKAFASVLESSASGTVGIPRLANS